MRNFGLIGKNISYSFSRKYFSDKFDQLEIEASYENFDCKDIDEIQKLFDKNGTYEGFNVTIPYKEQVIPFMSEMNKHARSIGAVNTIKRLANGKLKGYNTDHIGFSKSIKPYLKKHHKTALILGTGGASKAIAYALEMMDIQYKYVSRTPQKDQLSYEAISPAIISKYHIIINCSPIGTHPDIDKAPKIPYYLLTDKHLLYDLVYNPAETKFLREGKKKGAQTCNGLDMLKLQAEAAWRIWN